MRNFVVFCKKCGSEKVTVENESNYVFDGDREVLDTTGNIEVSCDDCGEYEVFKLV